MVAGLVVSKDEDWRYERNMMEDKNTRVKKRS